MKRLLNYDKIAIDFDDTIVSGDRGVTQPNILVAVQQFIMDNHTNKELYIVTHRSHGYEWQIADELEEVGLSIDMFVDVLNVPDEICDQFMQYEHVRWAHGENAPAHIRRDIELNQAPFKEWKGETCKAYGIPVLLDDRDGWNQAGCELHGIEFINTNYLVMV